MPTFCQNPLGVDKLPVSTNAQSGARCKTQNVLPPHSQVIISEVSRFWKSFIEMLLVKLTMRMFQSKEQKVVLRNIYTNCACLVYLVVDPYIPLNVCNIFSAVFSHRLTRTAQYSGMWMDHKLLCTIPQCVHIGLSPSHLHKIT